MPLPTAPQSLRVRFRDWCGCPRRRSEAETRSFVATLTGGRRWRSPDPASAGRTPRPSPRATHLQRVFCEQRCPEQRSHRTSPARNPAESLGRSCSGSLRVYARSSRARRPRRGASEGQGPVDREPCWNEAGSGNRVRAMLALEPARAWYSFP